MSIVDTIRLAANECTARTGRAPNAVYLGDHEQESLTADLGYAQYFNSVNGDAHRIDHLRIYRVHCKSHLTVCWTGEAER